jgi:hypothetical protein
MSIATSLQYCDRQLRALGCHESGTEVQGWKKLRRIKQGIDDGLQVPKIAGDSQPADIVQRAE